MKQAPINSGYGRDSTWSEIIEGADLSGRLAVITGGSAGLGRQTAHALGQAGADVFLGARSEEALAETRDELLGAGVKNVYTARLDLVSVDGVLSFAAAVKALERPVHFLIANAGVMASPLYRDDRGNEFQFSTNYLGHALLLSELAYPVIEASGSRVVALSSTGHHYSRAMLDDLNFDRRPYDKWLSYGQSKTASSLLAVKAAASLGAHGVQAFAVHPGMIATDLGKYITAEDFEETIRRMGELGEQLPPYKTLESGAATAVWAAISPQLNDFRFAYCEDCDVARVIESPNYGWGVLPYAIDEQAADQLWVAAEKLIGRPLPLA